MLPNDALQTPRCGVDRDHKLRVHKEASARERECSGGAGELQRGSGGAAARRGELGPGAQDRYRALRGGRIICGTCAGGSADLEAGAGAGKRA